MCYSAMVEQHVKKLARQYGAKVQMDLFDELFWRRFKGEKLYLGRGLEESFLESPKTAQEKKIAKSILEWHEKQTSELEQLIFAQKKRLDGAKKILSSKPTKKAAEDERIATNKIEKAKADIKHHRASTALDDSDYRVFAKHFVSVLSLDDEGEKVIRPMRYLMRPHNKDESFDKEYYGCYNARFDNLGRVEWWKGAMGKRHGVLKIRRFFENVDPRDYLKNKKHKLSRESKAKGSIVLCFEPEGVEFMYVPVLWDYWEKKGEGGFCSCALITDEPAPEIAEAGHDRTPIFLKESAIEQWLHAKGSVAEVKEALGGSHRESVYYKHRVLGETA